ncbi:MAG: hypothetical protein JJU02_03195 [Cryomorphaceae bacterium]|nr:hypothetical protein [Cryomorphaceae bacterium]
MQEQQKKEVFRGLALMFAALPFIFSGPALFFALGVPGIRDGDFQMALLSFLLMLIAGLLGVFGLKTVLRAVFQK